MKQFLRYVTVSGTTVVFYRRGLGRWRFRCADPREAADVAAFLSANHFQQLKAA